MARLYLVACVVILAAALSACDSDIVIGDDRRDVDGSGTIITETRDVADFDEVTLSGEGRVVVTAGPAASLTIETDDNLLQHIESTVSGGVLRLATEDGIDIDPSDSVIYRVSAPTIVGLTLTGAGDIELDEGPPGSLSIELPGAGQVEVANMEGAELDVTISGAGSVLVAGRVDSLDVSLPGAGSFRGRELQSTTAAVTTSGAGSAEVWATDTLSATVTGVGSIDYFGAPEVTQSVTGVGSINARGAP